MPVHFLDLASAVEKLRWAEKEWRELDRERAVQPSSGQAPAPRSPVTEVSGVDGLRQPVRADR